MLLHQKSSRHCRLCSVTVKIHRSRKSCFSDTNKSHNFDSQDSFSITEEAPFPGKYSQRAAGMEMEKGVQHLCQSF